MSARVADPELGRPKGEMSPDEVRETQTVTDPTALYARYRAMLLEPGQELRARDCGSSGFGDAHTLRLASRGGG